MAFLNINGPTGPMGLQGPTGPKGSKGDKGARGPTGPIGSSIISFYPFGSNSAGFNSSTYSDGRPAQVGIVSFGEVLTADVADGLTGTIAIPGFTQLGATMPVSCILDTICLTVGNPAFRPARTQAIHAFAMLATADGNSQLFTLQPTTKAEVTYTQGSPYPAQVTTIRATGLNFVVAAETRYILVCGHYTTGDIGATSCSFTYSGTVLFK